MAYTYKYPHPAVTTDVVAFTLRQGVLNLLLVRRKFDPFKDQWALPGGFVHEDEDLEACAHRELEEETGVKGAFLEQLYTFGAPDRDPRERVISVGYIALIVSDDLVLQGGTDAAEAEWFSVTALPSLAFDHDVIVRHALERLRTKISYSSMGLQFLPKTFTLTDVQTIYEAIRGEAIDKRNFRKWLLGLNWVKETGHLTKGGAHRPAKLYRLVRRSGLDYLG